MKNGNTYEIFIELQIILSDSFCFRIKSLQAFMPFFCCAISSKMYLVVTLSIASGLTMLMSYLITSHFKVLIQRSSKVSRGSFEKVIHVTFQLLVRDLRRRFQTSVFPRLVIDQCTGQRSATRKHNSTQKPCVHSLLPASFLANNWMLAESNAYSRLD